MSESPADRRAHPRLSASDLRGLKAARLKYGPEVNLIDLSAGGVLFVTNAALTPDSSIVFEFSSTSSVILVPSRVLRCEDVAAEEAAARFQGACVFKRPLALTELIGAPATPIATPGAAAWQKVVARFRDGRLLHGYSNDFHPSKPYLNVSSSPFSSDARFIQVSQLEALAFVREAGDQSQGGGLTHGRKLEVTLPNGEVLIGSTLNYRRDGNGFFIHPVDPASPNLRVFVTSDAVQHVRFL